MEIEGESSPFLWDCQWWSDFHDEAECLFLGGLLPFGVQSIRHIPSRTNYKRYIAPMNMLSCMLRGYHFLSRLATERDVNRLRELITEQIAEKHALSLSSATDGYILSLFHYYCVHLEKVVINMDWMHLDHYENRMFGYKMFHSLFFENENDNSLKLLYFLQFLPKLEEFVILHEPYDGFEPSILVNEAFIKSLLKGLDFINNHKTLKKSFVRFVVVKPKTGDVSGINGLVDKDQSVFIQKGWKVVESSYFDAERAQGGSALCFQKL